MRKRTLAAGVLAAGLVLTACGREGAPSDAGDGGNGDAAALSYEVAQDVNVEGSPTFDAMTERGHPVVGVKEDQPGLGYKNATTGEFSGFDIEIARMVTARLGFDPANIEYKVVPSAGREQALVNGDVDYYVGTYTINDKRKEQVGFAGPYYVAGQSLLVSADNEDIQGKEDLQGKKVCSVSGSTPIQRVREQNLTEDIVELQNYSQCVNELREGRVDAVTTDDAILLGYASDSPEELKVVGDTFSDEPYGIGVPKQDDALRAKVNDVLEESMGDGTWQEIYDATLGKSGIEAEMPTVERY